MALELRESGVPVTEVTFTTRNVGDADEERTLELFNTATSTVTLITEELPIGFSWGDFLYSDTIAGGAGLEIKVVSKTDVAGVFQDYFRVESNATNLELLVPFQAIITGDATEIPYSSRTRLDLTFGQQNINSWAAKSPARGSKGVQATIDFYIHRVSRLIDNELRGGHHDVPFSKPVPEVIQYLCTAKAGADMYTSVAMYHEQFDLMISRINKQFRTMLRDIKFGRIQLSDSTFNAVTYPVVYEE